MANWILNELLDEQIERLVKSFEISEKIFRKRNPDGIKKQSFHNGEYGTYREAICKEFLSFLTPQELGISTGFIITPNNEVSKQCDIVIFDKNVTPLIQGHDKQRFFPIESVIAVGEIKSGLGITELKKECNTLSEIKKFRGQLKHPEIYRERGKRDVKQFDEVANLNDQIFTFIICNNFNGYSAKNHDWFDGLYDDSIEIVHKHNMILSLQDGILSYSMKGENLKKITSFPIEKKKEEKFNLIRYPQLPNKVKLDDFFMIAGGGIDHIRTFASYYHQDVSHSTILFPDIVNYIGEHFE